MFFSESKWNILSELSKAPKSPIELSKIFNTTVANISQQLRLMEALGIVAKTKISNSKKGKPRTQYFIKDDIYYMVRLGKNFATKKSIKPEPHSAYIFNVFSKIEQKDHYCFFKFFWNNSKILSNSSIGLYKNTDKTIEFFIITEDIEKARKTLSNQEVKQFSGKARKVICWSHNKFEIDNGLGSNDPHFMNMIKESTILLDKTRCLEKYMEAVKK